MLRAARGFIVVDSVLGYPMKTYCKTFHTYANENYCGPLMRARSSLDFTSIVLDDYGLRVSV
ncbi:hypothetical protein ColLi_06307 [Colletotrichum liriopes]|uniref:Uncharacterized protein n=1 Tax=Colletotrichum liriopes TaxID=708192 RepID=A0AA37LSQ1_9PEZI|nr:hypothetical protein ColLi_06307 [Colletotrichum liriopes]